MNGPQLPLFDIPNVSNAFTPDAQIVVECSDTYSFLRAVPSDMAQLIITSPPYNPGKAYEVRQGLRQYLKQQAVVIDELVRVLHPEGSICWQSDR